MEAHAQDILSPGWPSRAGWVGAADKMLYVRLKFQAGVISGDLFAARNSKLNIRLIVVEAHAQDIPSAAPTRPARPGHPRNVYLNATPGGWVAKGDKKQ